MKLTLSEVKMDKKAISLMVSYVLLIIIAISLAAGIYAWFRFVIKGIEPIEECPEGVSLILKDYKCLANKKIQIEVENKGRFNISGYAIKGTDNKSQEAWFKLKDPAVIGGGVPGIHLFSASLPSAGINIRNFSYSEIPSGRLEKIEIDPFRIQEDKGKKNIIYCGDAVINQEVNCT